ncbi:hypothetical protein Slin14017_G091040 [Septoria linicola]|nr:hypothetical protein Slin14017_G091040 [Septoria linicola]
MAIAIEEQNISTLAINVKFRGSVEPEILADIAYLFASPSYLHRGPILRGDKLDLRQSALRGSLDSITGREISPAQAMVVHKHLTKSNPLHVKLLTEMPHNDVDDLTAKEQKTVGRLLVAA